MMEATGKAYITSVGRQVYVVGPGGNFASMGEPYLSEESAQMRAESLAGMLGMKKDG